MPYSSTNGKRFVSSCIELLEHKRADFRVLDLGAGSGTYSDLYRSRLKGHWTAVEIWEPYIEQFGLKAKYDYIVVMDALTYLSTEGRFETFDVIFLGDMLEHLPKESAIVLIEMLKDSMTPHGITFVSVPVGEYPQEAYLGNPYEAHLATWCAPDIEALKPDMLHYEGEIGVAVFGAPIVKIAATAIGRNEERFIVRMHDSVLACARLPDDLDKIASGARIDMHYLDTGSTDNTYMLALSHIGVLKSSKLDQAYFKPFRFDDARNAVLGMVPLSYDYVISIDCDELITSFDLLAFQAAIHKHLCDTGNLPDLIHHGFQTVWDWEGEGKNISKHFHSRLHRRTGCRWIHPVHEKLSWAKGAPIEMWHLGLMMEQRPDTSKDRSSYLDALRIAVKEDPKDWKLLCFLADEVSGLNFDEANGYLEKAFKLDDADKAYIALKQGFLHERYKSPLAGMHFADAAFRGKCRELVVYQAEYHARRDAPGDAQYASRLWAEAKAITTETQGYLRREDCWNGTLPQLA